MSDAVVPHNETATTHPVPSGWFRRALDSDLFYSFRRSRITMIAAAVTVLFFLLAIFASVLSIVITLAGGVEIGLGDGSLHRFGPGEGILAEDLTGHGHTTRAVGAEPRFTMAIPLDD